LAPSGYDEEFAMRPQHLARDETRDRILKVALQLIADQGFAGTSTREISECLGFTKAALYYHFHTKEDLLAAIAAPAMEDLKMLVEKERPRSGLASRRQVAEDYVDFVASHAELIRVFADDPSVRHREVLAVAFPVYDRLTQLLSGTEVVDTAQRVRVRAALGAIHAALLGGAPDDDQDVARAAAKAAAYAVLGFHAPRPA
jgi:AcrR family transcriptional regulator